MILSYIRRYDWLLVGAVFLLMVSGLLSLFSLSAVSPSPFFPRQLIWVAVGTGVFFGASVIDFRLFRTQSVAVFLGYAVIVFLLGLVLVTNVKTRGVESWLFFQGVSFQPVEAAKLALIILLAKFFSRRHVEIYRLQHLAVSAAYLFIPLLLVLLQPDLGSSLILVAIWVAIVIFSGMKLRHFFLLLGIFAIMSVVAWGVVLEPYQKERITSFLNPSLDPEGGGYQMIQSMIAVGSGKMWGKGLGYGSQTHLHFLPEAETDFIFAAFAEEWGFAGVAVVLSLFFVVWWRVIATGMAASDNFSRLYTLGFATLLFVQSAIHIGMNMGVLPITGITLPFVSYGGSSLVTLLAGLGIVQNIRMNSRRRVE